MSRARLFRTSTFAYHVTVRSNNKDWFYLPIALCWRYFEQRLVSVVERYRAEIHAFVLMSNHFHLILSTPDLNLDAIMRYLLTEVGRDIRQGSGRINHVFGTRYKWSVLPSSAALGYALKYVARNPVRAGLSSSVETYPYSTFRRPFSRDSLIPLVEGIGAYWRHVPRDESTRLAWLNAPSRKEREQLVAQALRRSSFGFPNRRDNRPGLHALTLDYGIPFEEALSQK